MSSVLASGFSVHSPYFELNITDGQGILAYGFSRINTPSLAGWRWIYIIEGAITIAVAFVAWFFLVDFPQRAKFLSEDERACVVERLNKDRGDGEHDEITFQKILHHLSDWKLWGFALIVLPSLPLFNGIVLLYDCPLLRVSVLHPRHPQWNGFLCRPVANSDCATIRPRRHRVSLNILLRRSHTSSHTLHIHPFHHCYSGFRPRRLPSIQWRQIIRDLFGSERSTAKSTCCTGIRPE